LQWPPRVRLTAWQPRWPAATEVCSDRRLPADQIAGALGALVDKSILKRQLTGTSARYWLLDTLRQ
jgi:hypothetical protein